MPGPGPRTAPRGQKLDLKANMGTIMRVLKYVCKRYGLQMVIVVVCIVITVLSNLQGTMFMQTLIDDYIMPMLKEHSNDFGPLLGAIGRVALFYAAGVISMFTQSMIMVYVTQGTLRDLRDDMFTSMEDLPIRYFDTHAHGDIMSVYTNDIDTLRQMISQSIPQLLNSLITIVGVFVCMVTLNIPLTILTLAMVGVMLLVTKKLGGNSAKYFTEQQKDLGIVNGNIEEMMNGQKVVKVFCHEEESIEQFNELNDQLFDSANKANKYANILMPANAQIGNISYVLVAVVGGLERHWRLYPGRSCQLPLIQPEFYHAHQPGQHAVELHRDGHGRSKPCVRAAG